jgi:nitronate monooxygenase
MTPKTQRLLDLLGTKVPLIQAPMAGVQLSAMTLAVSNAGALGSLPCAMLTPDALKAELDKIQAGSAKPYNVNFFCHTPPVPNPAAEARWREALAPYYAEHGIDPSTIPAGAGRVPFSAEAADVLEAFKPKVVSFHFGLPSPDLLARVKSWGSTVLSSATTVAEARWLEAHGADVIIAQGVEAGGHRGVFLCDDPCSPLTLAGQQGTFTLLPQIVAAVSCPVIAAGGIVDATTVRAAMNLGAAGVQVGTAYMLCHEATTSAVHRAALRKARDEGWDTALTNLFTGRPARGLVNRVMRELGPISDAAPAFPLSTAAIAPLRAKAEAQGSGDFSPLWSGQNPSACKEIGAAELTQQLASALELSTR